MKRTRIEVISVNRRVVSITGSDVRDGPDITDIDVLLSALGDIAPPGDELRHEMNEGGGEILRPPFQPLRLIVTRMQECFSHRFKSKRSNSHEE